MVTASRLLVPVSESVTLRNTVAYAVREALERAEEGGTSAAVHFVYPLSQRVTAIDDTGEISEARELLERVTIWAEEDLGDDVEAVSVATRILAEDEYLFSPRDYATVLETYARENGFDGVLFDPEYNPIGTTPLLPPLESEIRRAGLEVEEAPVERARRGTSLVRRTTVAQFLALFASTYLFYLLLAGSIVPFELATGAITAGLVSVTLWRVSLTAPLASGRTLRRLGRLGLYAPYLLWEITKANVEIAYVVLHPDLPIDPEMVEFDAAVWTPMSVTTLANSITLTPGTLTVDVTRRHFTVHALTAGSRDSLLAGGLERAVRFVFYGRAAARIPSPAERRETDEEGRERAEDDSGGDEES